jgi:tryptophan-rich sensory protein
VRSPSRLAISIVICYVPAGIGSFFTVPATGTWYAALDKPWFTPPAWVFGPVWTVLYLLMGISLYRLWMQQGSYEIRLPAILFGVQLALNALWSFLFFGLQSPFLGLIEIVALWISIAVTIAALNRIDHTGAVLLVPYILWVSLAGVLNYAVFQLNP